MGSINGSISVTGFIAPSGTEDTYATHDEYYNRGGYRTVSTIADRNNISGDRKKEGMLVNVTSSNTIFKLINNEWTNLDLTGDSLNRPTTTKIGLFYFDTTLGFPIWYNGTDWVNSTGTIC